MIPKKIKIGGHVIRIREEEIEDGSVYGMYEPDDDLIIISASLSQTQKEATLLHEIFHVINAQLDDTDTLHILLESLAQQLYQVLKDNKLHFK